MRVSHGFPYLIIAGLLGFIVIERFQTDTSPTPLVMSGDSSCAMEISTLREKIKILEDDHQRLHKRNVELLASNKRPVPQALPVAQPVITEQTDIEQLVAERQAEMDYARSFSTTFQHKMATIPNYSLAEDLDQQFNKQSIDPEWSLAQEGQLQELFHNRNELRQFALESVQCRTDGCRVKVLFTEPHEIDLAREALTSVLSTAEPRTLPSVVIAVPYPDTNRVDLYVARTANRHLFQ